MKNVYDIVSDPPFYIQGLPSKGLVQGIWPGISSCEAFPRIDGEPSLATEREGLSGSECPRRRADDNVTMEEADLICQDLGFPIRALNAPTRGCW